LLFKKENYKTKQMSRAILLWASAFLVLAVAIGAFGAHAVKSRIPNDLMQIYKTGVEYHFYHALGLLLIGLLSMNMTSNLINWSAFFIGLGIVLFSGSLYVLALTGIRWIGAITPFGGISFIAGWVLLFVAVFKR
jgi:uncharacterized membrane protein YgdD (TMEM256/DUF423 family)